MRNRNKRIDRKRREKKTEIIEDKKMRKKNERRKGRKEDRQTDTESKTEKGRKTGEKNLEIKKFTFNL